MSNEIESNEVPVETAEVSVDALQAQVDAANAKLEDYKAQVEATNNKNRELLSEKKKIQAREQELKAAKEREQEEQKKESGQFKDLYEAQLERANKIQQEYEATLSAQETRERKEAAYKLANSVTSGPRAEDMARHIEKRTDVDEHGVVRYKDEGGKVVFTSASELLEDMKASDRYKHLIEGPASSGGGAPGNTNSVSKNKPIPESQFNQMSPKEKIEFQKGGGRYEIGK